MAGDQELNKKYHFVNLFFVHTPFQLLVAQNLIIKKNLKNNVVAFSNTGPRARHFFGIFDKLLINSKWEHNINLGDLNDGIYSFRNPIRSYNNLRQFSKKVELLIKKYKVESLYFGDINHPAYILLGEIWNKKKHIFFFEEGLSHYTIPFINRKSNASFLYHLKTVIVDFFVFGSLGVKGFYKYYRENENRTFRLVIDKKYNILPFKVFPFDELIKFDIYLPEELEESLRIISRAGFSDDGVLNILYLSSTSTYLFTNKVQDEAEILIDRLRSIQGKYRLFIKYHPKDSEEKKKDLEKFLKDAKIENSEIFTQLSLPVEILFKIIRIDYLIGLGSSSQLYFKMMFPDVPNYNLIHSLKDMYEQKGIKNHFIENAWINWQQISSKAFGYELPKVL